MNIDIRKSILNNFAGANANDIKISIEGSIKENKEITLPGLGVFFEILWNNCLENDKEFIINTIKKGIK